MRESLERVRRVLAEQHIGIVVVGMLAFGTILQLVAALNNPLSNLVVWFYNEHRLPDRLAIDAPGSLPWQFTASQLFGVFVQLYLAVLVYWWIYGNRDEQSQAAEGL